MWREPLRGIGGVIKWVSILLYYLHYSNANYNYDPILSIVSFKCDSMCLGPIHNFKCLLKELTGLKMFILIAQLSYGEGYSTTAGEEYPLKVSRESRVEFFALFPLAKLCIVLGLKLLLPYLSTTKPNLSLWLRSLRGNWLQIQILTLWPFMTIKVTPLGPLLPRPPCSRDRFRQIHIRIVQSIK